MKAWLKDMVVEYGKTEPVLKYLRDIDGVVHCSGAVASGEFSLCGMSLDGVNGDEVMAEVSGPITCNNCIGTILHCKTIKRNQMKQ